MLLLVSSCHVGAPHEGYQHGVSIQSSINLGKTFLSILLIWYCTDLILGKAVWIFTSFHFPDFGLNLLNGFDL